MLHVYNKERFLILQQWFSEFKPNQQNFNYMWIWGLLSMYAEGAEFWKPEDFSELSTQRYLVHDRACDTENNIH